MIDNGQEYQISSKELKNSRKLIKKVLRVLDSIKSYLGCKHKREVSNESMNELECMLNAYRHLYEIENRPRLIIKTNMQKQFGPQWPALLHEKRCEHDSFYHELIAFFGKYPQVLPHFNILQRKKLQSLTPIRNKIAHSHLIDLDEFKLLEECHYLVLQQPITERKKPIKAYR